jgi:hypothetical protein
MEQHIFSIFIDYRGHHRKGAAFIMPLKSIYNKTLVSLNKNLFLNTTEKFKQEKLH